MDRSGLRVAHREVLELLSLFPAGSIRLQRAALRTSGILHPCTAKAPPGLPRWGSFSKIPCGDLLSHTVTHAVPSAQRGLTSVFGMGTGVTLSV